MRRCCILRPTSGSQPWCRFWPAEVPAGAAPSLVLTYCPLGPSGASGCQSRHPPARLGVVQEAKLYHPFQTPSSLQISATAFMHAKGNERASPQTAEGQCRNFFRQYITVCCMVPCRMQRRRSLQRRESPARTRSPRRKRSPRRARSPSPSRSRRHPASRRLASRRPAEGTRSVASVSSSMGLQARLGHTVIH